MKTVKKVLVFLLVSLCIFSACSGKGKTLNDKGVSIPGNMKISAEEFTQKASAAAYTVEDITGEAEELYGAGNGLVTYLAAYKNQSAVEYMVLQDVKAAKEGYVKKLEELDKKRKASTKVYEYFTETYAKYVYDDLEFYSITRIDNTLVYAVTTSESKEATNNFLLRIGY